MIIYSVAIDTQLEPIKKLQSDTLWEGRYRFTNNASDTLLL